jgi:hypothetical protein
MFRYILISFGFLGFAFYELSGGADFDPVATRMARLEAEAPTPFDQPDTREETRLAAAEVAPLNQLDNETVTRVSLNLVSLQDALDQSGDAAQVPAQPVINAAAPADVPVNVPVITASADTPAIIPSLIAPQDTTAALTEPETELRRVTGNRVNVRGGPSTSYAVVGKLSRGDAVEVLEDTGSGWVKMRAVDTGEIGWLADFLLTES